eukprot:EG_transcript_28724
MAAPSPGPRSGATASRSSAAEAELAGLDGEWRREYRQYVAQKDSPSTGTPSPTTRSPPPPSPTPGPWVRRDGQPTWWQFVADTDRYFLALEDARHTARAAIVEEEQWERRSLGSQRYVALDVCSRLLLWRTEKAEVDGRFAIEDLEEWTRGLAREKSGHALRALRAMSSQLPAPPEAPPEAPADPPADPTVSLSSIAAGPAPPP